MGSEADRQPKLKELRILREAAIKERESGNLKINVLNRKISELEQKVSDYDYDITPRISVGFSGDFIIISLQVTHKGKPVELKCYPKRPSSIILEDAIKLAVHNCADLHVQAELLGTIT